MGDMASGTERRSALRVPVRGYAMVYDAGRTIRAIVENLSTNGALVSVPASLGTSFDDLELNLGFDSGRVAARTVRVERGAARTRIALEFEQVDPALRLAVASAIDFALMSALRRPIVILDDNPERRDALVERLRRSGMTAIAPRTPLAAFDQLARTSRVGCVCVMSSCFGQSVVGLRNVIAETFPWVLTNVIGDDLDGTVDRALASWADTDAAQLVRALA